MTKKRMGFEGVAYIGTAGSTASNQLTNSRDISPGVSHEQGDTIRRGNSVDIPKKSSRVVAIGYEVEIVMLNDDGDTHLETMKQAAAAGTPLALRLKDFVAGKGFDGDVTLAMSLPWPLGGEQVITFTCTPTEEAGREWQPYV